MQDGNGQDNPNTPKPVPQLVPDTPNNPHKRSNEDFASRVAQEQEQVQDQTEEQKKQSEEAAARVKVVAIQFDPVTQQIQSRPVRNITNGFELISFPAFPVQVPVPVSTLRIVPLLFLLEFPRETILTTIAAR